MKKTLWICLLTLAVVVSFFSSHGLSIFHSCCMKPKNKPWPNISKPSIGPIKECYVQHSRPDCKHHAFHIKTNSGKSVCLDPDTPWLKKEINEGRLECGPEFSIKGRFEVLDEDDLE